MGKTEFNFLKHFPRRIIIAQSLPWALFIYPSATTMKTNVAAGKNYTNRGIIQHRLSCHGTYEMLNN